MTMKAYTDMITLKFEGDLNALGAAAALDLGTPPDDFVVVDGFVDCAMGTTNNELSLGDGTDADLYLADITFAAATIDGLDVLVTGRGTKFDGTKTLTATNTGSAAVPSAATALTVTLIGYMEHEA